METVGKRRVLLFLDLYKKADRWALEKYLGLPADAAKNISDTELSARGIDPAKFRELHDLRIKLKSGEIRDCDNAPQRTQANTAATTPDGFIHPAWAASNAKLVQGRQWEKTHGQL